VRHLAPMQRPRKMPAILSQDEVAGLIEAAPSLKYRAALSVAYGAGLGCGDTLSGPRPASPRASAPARSIDAFRSSRSKST
jgi:hypothetical protein